MSRLSHGFNRAARLDLAGFGVTFAVFGRSREHSQMDGGDLAYLILVVAAFVIFAGSLFINAHNTTNDPREGPPRHQ
jgi:hypothetical protein